MRRFTLSITFFLCVHFTFGESSVIGKYSGTGMLLDTLNITFRLSLKEDGNYSMKSLWNDSLITETGKWRQNGLKIKLIPKYSKEEKRYALQTTFFLNIESDSLVWKPRFNKRKFEKEMCKNSGEKVTLVDKSAPLILQKEN